MRAMPVALVAAVVAALAGLVVIALPDSGPRLFSLSEEHGPSALDAVGIALLVAGWLVLASQAWRRRDRIARLGARRVNAGLFLLGLGLGLLVASVLGDYDWWWALGAALLALVQVGAFVAALRGGG